MSEISVIDGHGRTDMFDQTFILTERAPVPASPVPASKFRTARTGGRYFGKRAFDVTVSGLLLVLLMPLILVLALLVSLDGHCPFFVQSRIGRNGKAFRMIKLRTMVPEADARLSRYLRLSPDAKTEWECFQKLAADPRITRIGGLLRRASLDELPQLFNVLAGDMSLVGPRPMLPEQRSLYPGDSYDWMRPGITGPWQVSDRNSVSFADRARFDTGYFEQQSIWRDLEILLCTVRTVCGMTGR